MELVFEELTRANYDMAWQVDRTDIPEDYVDGVPTLIETLEYGFEHGCIGHAFAVSLDGRCIATILLGEALEWKTDPPEVKQRPFYRLMFFVVDRRYRDRGLGGEIREKTISRTCADFGVRPIVTGVHRDNAEAVRFYERHGFNPTPYVEGNDCYYLRYPHE
jgi:GNAT superfamily N-acetyltransferase